LGTISKRFLGSYPSTIMVAPLLWRFLCIRILQERPISHRKLSRVKILAYTYIRALNWRRSAKRIDRKAAFSAVGSKRKDQR
jgi:hypothetical protein